MFGRGRIWGKCQGLTESLGEGEPLPLFSQPHHHNMSHFWGRVRGRKRYRGQGGGCWPGPAAKHGLTVTATFKVTSRLQRFRSESSLSSTTQERELLQIRRLPLNGHALPPGNKKQWAFFFWIGATIPSAGIRRSLRGWDRPACLPASTGATAGTVGRLVNWSLSQ